MQSAAGIGGRVRLVSGAERGWYRVQRVTGIGCRVRLVSGAECGWYRVQSAAGIGCRVRLISGVEHNWYGCRIRLVSGVEHSCIVSALSVCQARHCAHRWKAAAWCFSLPKTFTAPTRGDTGDPTRCRQARSARRGSPQPSPVDWNKPPDAEHAPSALPPGVTCQSMPVRAVKPTSRRSRAVTCQQVSSSGALASRIDQRRRQRRPTCHARGYYETLMWRSRQRFSPANADLK